DSLKVMKDSVATKRKRYSTLVRVRPPVSEEAMRRVSAMTDIELKQKTPVRVSERRADMVREKMVHTLNVTAAEIGADTAANGHGGGGDNDGWQRLRVELTTSAGTYVKEFVHGDGGRTEPNLWELLGAGEAAVEALDVTWVELDWPPPTTTTTNGCDIGDVVGGDGAGGVAGVGAVTGAGVPVV
ncbi:hypothetical protein HK405_013205, partial [Cladochytrium tenue]